MSEYTPTTEEVGAAYRVHGHLVDDSRYLAQGKQPLADSEYREEFDRWIAAVEREAAARALEGAAEAFDMATINITIFGDSAEARSWQASNDTRARMVASLRARADEMREGGPCGG